MRRREFAIACAEEFGETYSGVLIRDHWLSVFGGTAAEALDRGVAARDVWLALCEDLGVPSERWHGRGLRDPRNA